LSSVKKIPLREEKQEPVNLSEDTVQEDYSKWREWSTVLGYFTIGMLSSGIMFAFIADAKYDVWWYALLITSFIGWLVLRVLGSR
jgi:hypothetical protein